MSRPDSGPAKTVLVAGHLCLDLTPQLDDTPGLEPGRLYEVGPVTVSLGGCVANTALALQAAGVRTQVSGTVGGDALGVLARRLLVEQGLHSDGIATAVGATTSYSLVFQPRGQDRTFWHHAGANADFLGRDVELDGVDVLHVGYPPLLPALLSDDGQPLLELLQRARDRGITTSLDLVVVDPRSAVGRLDWRRIFARVLPYVDLATPSIDDLTSALGLPSPADDSAVAAVVESCAVRLIEQGCAVAAVSAGARGAYVLSGDLSRLATAGTALAALAPDWSGVAEWVPAEIPRTVQSTNGAGDAASAGLLYGLTVGAGLRGSARLAARFAAARIAGEPLSTEIAGQWAVELDG
jgi:sugar/nucleoside kinase (ribokinase family)